MLRLQSVTEKKKERRKEGEEATLAQVVGFNTLNNFCLCGFFFLLFYSRDHSFVALVARNTFERARLSFPEETFSSMTRQQQQQRDEGDDAIFAFDPSPNRRQRRTRLDRPAQSFPNERGGHSRRPPIGIGPVASVVGVRESVLGRG